MNREKWKFFYKHIINNDNFKKINDEESFIALLVYSRYIPPNSLSEDIEAIEILTNRGVL